MTLKNPIKRKAEVKKAAPNIYKNLFDTALGVVIGWSFAHYAVDSFEGTWPNVSMVEIILKLIEDLWFIGGLPLARWVFEIYRKRT